MRRTLLILVLAAESSCWTSPRVPPAAAAMSAMSASAHVSVLRRSPPPRALLASFSSPFARTRTDSNVTIRGASATDLPALANLCTDAFFGTHTFGDGPVIFAQRSAIYAKVFAQLARRIGIEDGREARLLVAVDPSTGALRGCVDLAVHLFDRLEQRFELTIDEMPENGRKRYSWLPYVASLAVSPESRRQGIARQLMREAEHRARFEWGYREMCLEAACCNLDAINFYKRLGYTIVRSDVPGTGATIVETRGFYWEVLPVEKYLMKRRLSGF